MDVGVKTICRVCGLECQKQKSCGHVCHPCRRARSRFHYHANRDEYRAIARNYIRNNPVTVMLRDARGRAKRKGLPFSITKADIAIPELCPVLGIPLIRSTGSVSPASPSLDRIDNSKGYIPGNVCVISHRANMLKNSASLDELHAIWNYVSRHDPGGKMDMT